MDYTKAVIRISGLSPYSQSHQHDEPFLEGESHDDYDARTWPHKMNLNPERTSVIIPAAAMHMALTTAAKYTKKKIVGQGNATWTAKFASGVMVPYDLVLNIDPATVTCERLSMNADGVRGSGKRVMRRFPMMYKWSAQFEVWILDPIITQAIFTEMADICGMFVGLGRWRPEKGGTNGRFEVLEIVWEDNRQPLAA